MKKVMVFGTFDGIHEGHRAFFKEAKSHGDYLMAVVAQDHVVKHLKGHLPAINLEERFHLLDAEDGVDEVIVGDPTVGTRNVVREYRPEVVAVGYDQDLLRENLETHLQDFNWPLEVVKLSAYEPDKYHTSKLITNN